MKMTVTVAATAVALLCFATLVNSASVYDIRAGRARSGKGHRQADDVSSRENMPKWLPAAIYAQRRSSAAVRRTEKKPPNRYYRQRTVGHLLISTAFILLTPCPAKK